MAMVGRFPLPSLHVDGFGAALAPARVAPAGRFTLAVVFPRSRKSEAQSFRFRVSEAGFRIGAMVERPSALVLPFEPGKIDLVRLWGTAGVTPSRMAEGNFSTEGVDGLVERWNWFLRFTDLKEAEITPRRIGVNWAGYDVFDSVLGRHALDGVGHPHYETEIGRDGKPKGVHRAMFLRASDAEDLRGVARGFARQIVDGGVRDRRDTARIYETAVSSSVRNVLTQFRFEEEIEIALARQFVKTSRAGEEGAEAARVIVERMPAHAERTGGRMIDQQYSTPFTLAHAAHRVLDLGAGARVLEPSVGNGVLAALPLASGAEVVGIESDVLRLDRARSLLEEFGKGRFDARSGKAERVLDEAGFRGQLFDAVIANPPFSEVAPTVRRDSFGREVMIRTLDQDIVFKALSALKDDGKAFLIMPAVRGSTGELTGRVANFDRFLTSSYEVAGRAVVDGRLYSKFGAAFPVVLYALGSKLSVPEAVSGKSGDAVQLPFLRTVDELNAWAEAARTAMAGLAARREIELRDVVEQKEAAPSEPIEEFVAATASELPVGQSGREPLPRGEFPPFGDLPEGFVDDVIVNEDPFQVVYEARSKVSGPVLRIQRSLAGPVAAALDAIQERHGDVDAYVAGKIGYKPDELGAVFHAAQIDGLALAFDAMERGRGMLNGAKMGVGKGRMHAALALAALRSGRPVFFETMKPDLFQDWIARDFAKVARVDPADLGSVIRPFILNDDMRARIYHPRDLESGRRRLKPLFTHDAGIAKVAKGGGGLPTDVNLVLATYSQFSNGQVAWKVEAIKQWMRASGKPPLIIADESHKAAGELSKVSEVTEALIAEAERLGGDVQYGSGTALKGAKNVKIYHRALPQIGMPIGKLVELMLEQPIALQESLSYEMARSGLLFQVELDESDMERKFVSLRDINPEKYDRLIGKVDEFSAFLLELLAKGGEVKAAADVITERLKAEAEAAGGDAPLSRVGAQLVSPASRFHTISQYLMFAFKTQFADELIVSALARGRKPIIAIDNTGDSLIEYRLGIGDGDGETNDDVEMAPGRVFNSPPNLGDVLKRTADRMLDLVEGNAFGVKTRRRLTEFEPWLEDFVQRVDEHDFAVFPTTGLDVIREICERRGLRYGELTGRKWTVVAQEEGGYRIEARQASSAKEVGAAYNNGRIDVLAMNRSGSTGYSFQASLEVGVDLRRRETIKLQMQPDITDENQIDGRTHRAGQVFAGAYVVPMSGLAADDRQAMLFNSKNMSLTAASSASRESSRSIREVPDLMNVVGEEVVFDWLRENPTVASMLAIDIDVESETGFARKLVGRLVGMPKAVQSSVMAELDSMFEMRAAALDAKGENPLRLRQYEWGGDVEAVHTLVAGDANSDVLGEKPLYLNKVSYPEIVVPQRVDEITDAIGRAEQFAAEATGRPIYPDELLPELGEKAQLGDLDFAAGVFDRIMGRSEMARSFGSSAIDVSEAASIWDNRAKFDSGEEKGRGKGLIGEARKAQFLALALPYLKPGAIVELNPDLFPAVKESRLGATLSELGGEEARVPAVITSVRFDEDAPLKLGSWDVMAFVPGEAYRCRLSLAGAYGLALAEREGSDTPRREIGEEVLIAPGNLRDVIEHRDRFPALKDALGNVVVDPMSLGVPKLGDGSGRARVMEALIDTAPGGTVRRSRFTLEGNVFEAVQVGSRGKLGEKGIYTTRDGELRHAIIVRPMPEGKMFDKIDAGLRSRSLAREMSEDLVRSVLSLHEMLQRRDYSPEDAAHYRSALAVMARELGGMNGQQAAIFAGRDVLARREMLVRQVAREKSTCALYVGRDPCVGEKAAVTLMVAVGEGDQCYGRSSIEANAVQIASKLDSDGAVLVVGGRERLMIAGVKNELGKTLGRDWGRRDGRYNVTGRMVCKLLSVDEAAQAMVLAAAEHGFVVQARGGVRAMLETVKSWCADERRHVVEPAPELGATAA